MGILGEEYGELTLVKRKECLRCIGEELHIALAVELLARGVAVATLRPSVLLVGTHHNLDIEVAVVHLESRLVARLQIYIHNIHKEVAAIDIVATRLELSNIGRCKPVEGLLDAWRERVVLLGILNRVYNLIIYYWY